MINASSLIRELAALKPGDTFVLPAGDIIGNISLPRGLSGAKGKFITIGGLPSTRIIATDKGKAAFGGGGCKWLRIMDFETVGGLNGVAVSQNGDEYDRAKMIEQIYIMRIRATNPVDDGIKANGGIEVHSHSCIVRGGRDQGIDYLGIDRGSIRLCDIAGAPTGIVTKGGCRRIAVFRNTIRDCRDGLHIGERTAPQWQAPWTGYSAEHVDVRSNDISVSGNPIVASQALGINPAKVIAGNALTTTKRARGQMAPLVEVNG
ncbi:hypothetical protein [Sphingobium xenophagum]|uniref:hypothetical protein n=1 Tax=Sphingobium xenophagum TaxID=121428 RepID=UPI0002ED0F61|nr:hypothetical protein [Sphingobium xenophagum]